MKNKIVSLGGAVTQEIGAVVELLKYLQKPANPLPEAVELPGLFLVLSAKRDVFYIVTGQYCSCPSFAFRGGPCKHQRKYFSDNSIKRQSLAKTLDEADKNLERMPKRYQRMVLTAREATEEDPDSLMPKGKWPGGYNGPVDPDIIKAESMRKGA